MKTFRIFQMLLLVFTFSLTSSFGQKIENLDTWMKIQPLINTREDVERIYGKTDKSQHSVQYKTADMIINIEYSHCDCKSKEGIFNVPEWTVERVEYFINNLINLKGLKLNLKRYKLEQKGDVEDYLTYSDADRGLSIVFNEETKSVRVITLIPSKKAYDNLLCKS